jgi:hypothetical protein
MMLAANPLSSLDSPCPRHKVFAQISDGTKCVGQDRLRVCGRYSDDSINLWT